MDLLTFVATIIAVIIVCGALRRFGPKVWIDESFLGWLIWFIIIVTVLWALKVLGVFSYFSNVTMPHLGR